MAAHDYYNSFNGGTPQMMNQHSAQQHAPPPPYQAFYDQPQPQQPAQPPSQPPYNIGDYKPNYNPENQYQNMPPPQPVQQVHFPSPPIQPQRPYQAPRPQMHQLQTGPPQGYVPAQQRPYASTTDLRPLRSSSEPPSPSDRYERSPSRRPHRNHKHHHSRPRSRSRDRSGRYPTKSKSEKNTFLGAIGGSVVGDLIFPGLGTIGGAVLGGWGGHEATKKKEGRERGERRSRRRGRSYEEEWEEGKRRRGEY